MGDPYIIRVSSQKGGVGKTVVAINFATALKAQGYKVLLIDSDFSNPSVGIYLGLEDVNIGYREVIIGKVDALRAIVPHQATGLSILPGSITTKQFIPGRAQIDSIAARLRKLKYDFIIVDTEPGIIIPGVFKIYDEAVIITTPEMSACLSAVKLAQIYNREKLKHNLVVNRVKNKRYEISIEEIEEIYENRVESVLPEDEIVPLSIAQHIPAYNLNRRAQFSRAVYSMARLYAGRVGTDEIAEKKVKSGGLLAFLKRIFHLR